MSSNPIQYSKLGEKCLPVGVEIIPNLVCDNDVTGQKVGPDDVWGDVSILASRWSRTRIVVYCRT